MEWIGWVLALAAIAAAFVLWRRLGAERAHASELLYARLEAENEVEALHAKHAQLMESARAAAFGGPLAEAAAHLHGRLDSARSTLETAGAELGDYRERVGRYDSAVQYCLQPVELILGADKATVEQLMQHVEGARRKLFEARALLTTHALHKGQAALGGGLGQIRALADYSRSLQAFSAQDETAAPAADVNACMDDALRVLAPRLGDRVRIGRAYAELPALRVPAAEVRQLFLHVLDHAARTIEAQGTLTATTRRGDVGVEIAIAETGSAGSERTPAAEAAALFVDEAADEAAVGLSFAQQLVEDLGGTISVRTTRGLGSTFTLVLPLVPAQAPAAAA